MHAQTYGDGHRIFIGYHGWGSEQGRSFKELLPFLPEDVTLIGVDLPGCGKSERVEPWGWEHLNDEVARHLDHLPDTSHFPKHDPSKTHFWKMGKGVKLGKRGKILKGGKARARTYPVLTGVYFLIKS